jgi:hypothetical protein
VKFLNEFLNHQHNEENEAPYGFKRGYIIYIIESAFPHSAGEMVMIHCHRGLGNRFDNRISMQCKMDYVQGRYAENRTEPTIE